MSVTQLELFTFPIKTFLAIVSGMVIVINAENEEEVKRFLLEKYGSLKRSGNDLVFYYGPPIPIVITEVEMDKKGIVFETT